jgi:hypothetical protein
MTFAYEFLDSDTHLLHRASMTVRTSKPPMSGSASTISLAAAAIGLLVRLTRNRESTGAATSLSLMGCPPDPGLVVSRSLDEDQQP